MLPESRKRGIPDEEVYPLFTRAAIGAIIGARVAYVINHLGDYELGPRHPPGVEGRDLPAGRHHRRRPAGRPPDEGSGSCRSGRSWTRPPPAWPSGITVGRIGDLIIGDHLGKTTDFFLGYRCPPAGVEVGSPCVPGTIVHQTALYDQILAFVLLMVLLRLRKRVRYDGFLAMVFVAWYAIATASSRTSCGRTCATSASPAASGGRSPCCASACTGCWSCARTPKWGRWDDEPRPTTSRPHPVRMPPTLADDEPERGRRARRARRARDFRTKRTSVAMTAPRKENSSGDPDRGHSVPEGDRDRHG